MLKTVIIIFAFVVTVMALPCDSPILPWDYQKLLGHGFDVAWAEFKVKIEGYGVDEVSAMKAHGFKTARIRTNLPANDSLFAIMDVRVKDCLDSGIVPMLAYQGGPMEADPKIENIDFAVEWWRSVASHYADYSHRLAFNLVVEWTDSMSKDAALINTFYSMVTPAIRQTNPTRILIYAPKRISNPAYLDSMVIPSSAGIYVMAEWHFYAAGPSSDPASSKYWTTGTPEQKKLLTDKVDFATAWQKKTGIPTWVGAWMAGNYNHGNSTPMETHIGFATYMISVLDSVRIPWCINTIDKFYDYTQNKWIDSMKALLDIIDGEINTGMNMENAHFNATNRIKITGNRLILGTAGAQTVKLINLLGREILLEMTYGNSIEIPHGLVVPGMYYVQVKSQNTCYNTRLMVGF